MCIHFLSVMFLRIFLIFILACQSIMCFDMTSGCDRFQSKICHCKKMTEKSEPQSLILWIVCSFKDQKLLVQVRKELNRLNFIISCENAKAGDNIPNLLPTFISYGDVELNLSFESCWIPKNFSSITQKFPFTKSFSVIDFLPIASQIFFDMMNTDLIELKILRVTKITANAFTNLVSLETLELALGSFEAISSKLFINISNLKTLRLVENGIKVIPGNIFTSCLNLETIHLGGNKLESFER